MKALHGIKVLDFTHYIAGPYCALTLADHGAEVIKIEPLNGEASRKSNPMYQSESIYYHTMNRNKKGLALDMKKKESKEVIEKLVKSADIVVTNYAIGVPERLGIGYEQISKINPKIIMVHITGFGLTGPMKNSSAFDGVIQAMSGMSHLTGEKDGPPLKSGIFIADHLAAFNGVIGALLALQSRALTGKGKLVDVSMLDAMVSMHLTNFSEVSILNESPKRTGARSANVFASNFPTKDGYLYIAPLSEKMWVDFSKVIGMPELSDENGKYATVNGRLEHYDELVDIVSKWTVERTTDQIINLLDTERIPNGKVNSIEDLLENEQLKARDMLLNFEFKDKEMITPGVVVKLDDEEVNMQKAPTLGEHTTEILQNLGLSDTAITSLYENEVVRTNPKQVTQGVE
jgi:crotonobetainyl-CoA:carnitine CoA-transferase CaiB-like acyl-CoA transferase